jgi:hypothetical protein
MELPKLLQDIIKDEVLEHGWTLADALREHSQVEHWLVRKAYADAQRQHRVEYRPTISELNKKASTVLNAGWFQPVTLKLSKTNKTRPIFESAGRQILIINDIHAPVHDPHAMDVMFQVGRALPLDEVVINGDLFDCAALSRFTPSAQQPLRWVDERLESLPIVGEIRSQFGDLPIKYRLGNHDIRVHSWIDAHATPLQGLFTIEQMMGISDLNFDIVDSEHTYLAEGKLMIKHGTKVSKFGGYSVKKEVDDAGMSVIMGHVHRRAIIEVRKTAHNLIGVEGGCLCDLNPSYINPEDTANWQQAATVVTEYGDGSFDVELVRIQEGKAMFRGKMFSSRL